MNHTWTDWVRAAQKYQQKYLLVQANLGDRRSKDPPKGQKNRSKEQWQQALRPKPRDPNAMEIDRVRARQVTMDKRAEFMKAGKCFTCRKQGHCYDKARTFHFSTFIYHVYYYSRSHDRRVFTFAHDSLRVFPWTAFPIRLDITHPSTPLTQY
jgi:hypothetical protein